MDAMEWRGTMGKFATGVTVITTIDEQGSPVGMTANAFTSLSLDPPMVLICVDNKSDTLAKLLASNKYCVNILADNQEEVSRKFARKGGPEKFEDAAYRLGESGVPVLEGCLVSVECQVKEAVQGGDHVVLLGEGLHIHQTESETQPLLFYRGKYEKLNIIGA
ncbi:flavin reductase family protein [Paenibacillus sinopodophylli]|uniref:flavin reductase family protein n=1 Tax=Paenibacillus sinopodophylli TaxID=1837342 RepID=UPI001487476C|nr:flavin reductase family protein [Paenibacillus sinopodophylli]